MSQAGFVLQSGVAGVGPAAYIEDSSGDSVAIGLNGSGSFVIVTGTEPVSTAAPPQFEIDTSGNITLIAADTVNIGQGSLKITGVGGYLVLPPSGFGTPSQGFISFDGTGSTPYIQFEGVTNSFFGAGAGNFPGISGSNNTGCGYNALSNITSGNSNCAIGRGALTSLTTGIGCVGVGDGCYNNITTSQDNVGLGTSAASNVITGNNSVIIGAQALNIALTCSNTVAIGQNCLAAIGSSTNNIAIGQNAGSMLTATNSNNIIIGSLGVSGDNGVTRIGTQGTQTGCQIAGISGGTLLGAPYVPVMVATDGSLGTIGGGTDGQILIGSSATSPSWANITAGTNITITNNPNAITINATGPASFTWTEVASPTYSMSPNSGYIINSSSTVVITLPFIINEGQIVSIVGKGTGGWSIAQNPAQIIHYGTSNTTTGIGGSLSSTNQYDCVDIICTTTNNNFVVRSSVGNLTVV